MGPKRKMRNSVHFSFSRVRHTGQTLIKPINRIKNVFTFTDLALEEAYEKRLAELRDRVQYAESLNKERENDVHHLRQQMSMLLSAQNQRGNG